MSLPGILRTPWIVLMNVGQKAPIKITQIEADLKDGKSVIA